LRAETERAAADARLAPYALRLEFARVLFPGFAVFVAGAGLFLNMWLDRQKAERVERNRRADLVAGVMRTIADGETPKARVAALMALIPTISVDTLQAQSIVGQLLMLTRLESSAEVRDQMYGVLWMIAERHPAASSPGRVSPRRHAG